MVRRPDLANLPHGPTHFDMDAMSVDAIIPAPSTRPGAPMRPRFDRKFVDEHRIVERYLEGMLPLKGAMELESWCRQHPEYLEGLKLSERATASLRLLEATGRPADLGEPKTPWWRTLYCTAGLSVVAIACLVACCAVYGKYAYQRGQLRDARLIATQGALAPAGTERSVRLEPDHAPGLGTAGVTVTRSNPELIRLLLAMGYSQGTAFRLTVDKRDQGRALVVENLLEDSNGDLRLAFNSSGLSPGAYDVRIESLPPRGAPVAVGWFRIEAH